MKKKGKSPSRKRVTPTSPVRTQAARSEPPIARPEESAAKGSPASANLVREKPVTGKAAAGQRVATKGPREPAIVGIGASAGGLDAFTQLLQALPGDTGMAFVLVQHLEPSHESILTRLLARATKMPVQEVREGMRVEANHVYVIPANADLSLLEGLLHLEGREAPAGHHMPIDYFLRSLAESRGSRAIGVILSGTASDGTAGLKAIKRRVESPSPRTPEIGQFRRHAAQRDRRGCVDLVLPPERIATELARIARHPFVMRTAVGSVPHFPARRRNGRVCSGCCGPPREWISAFTRNPPSSAVWRAGWPCTRFEHHAAST